MTNFAKPPAPMHLYTTTEIEPSCIFLSSQDLLLDTVEVKIILLLMFKKIELFIWKKWLFLIKIFIKLHGNIFKIYIALIHVF